MLKNKIVQQACHSRSFVRNHCANYITPKVNHELCDSVCNRTKEICQSQEVQQKAKEVGKNFKKLNCLFYNVHSKISHSYPILPSDIGEMEEDIDNYMAFYREMFLGKVIPKQHMLEEHVPRWLRRWRYGMGRHGEQGCESTHKQFNQLERTHKAIQNEEKQLVTMMKEHLVSVSPVVQNNIVLPVKRSKKNTK